MMARWYILITISATSLIITPEIPRIVLDMKVMIPFGIFTMAMKLRMIMISSLRWI